MTGHTRKLVVLAMLFLEAGSARFEIAPPGKSDGFKTDLEGTVRRKDGSAGGKPAAK
jgi:hypothetical protein